MEDLSLVDLTWKEWNQHVLTLHPTRHPIVQSSSPLNSTITTPHPFLPLLPPSLLYLPTPHTLCFVLFHLLFKHRSKPSKHVPDFRLYNVRHPAELKKTSISFAFFPLSPSYFLFLIRHSFISLISAIALYIRSLRHLHSNHEQLRPHSHVLPPAEH